MEKAIGLAGPLSWREFGDDPDGPGETVAADAAAWGDVVLAGKFMPAAYHLAVVVDDALQGVTDVVRGRDLYFATAVHRLLQTLLGLPAPRYHHHRLIAGPDGRKLSKKLRNYPDPEEVMETIGSDALRWYLMSSPILRGTDASLSFRRRS